MSDSDSKDDYPCNSFKSPVRESMVNTVGEIDKQRFHLIYSHYPGLDKKEFCVCMGSALQYGIQTIVQLLTQ